MTGREVYNRLSNVDFYIMSLDFLERDKDNPLTFDSNAKALEFLTLYCVLLSTGEFPRHDENKILENYNFIKSRLQENGRICTKEFLSNSSDKTYFVVRDNVAFMLQTI